jgi:uncharacterized protein (UPF0333 family)
MLLFLSVVVVLVVIAWWINHKDMKELEKKPLFVAAKKVESAAKDIADVNNDGKVDLKDVVAAVKAAEQTGKKVVKKAAKITTKKKGK